MNQTDQTLEALSRSLLGLPPHCTRPHGPATCPESTASCWAVWHAGDLLVAHQSQGTEEGQRVPPVQLEALSESSPGPPEPRSLSLVLRRGDPLSWPSAGRRGDPLCWAAAGQGEGGRSDVARAGCAAAGAACHAPRGAVRWRGVPAASCQGALPWSRCLPPRPREQEHVHAES